MIRDENIPVVLVDSECAVCTNSVKFIRRHLKKSQMVFRSLWSEEGRAYLKRYNLPDDYDQSLVYIYKNKAYLKTGAVLRIAQKMKGLFPAFSMFLIVPAPVRDWFYKLVARHRHLIS